MPRLGMPRLGIPRLGIPRPRFPGGAAFSEPGEASEGFGVPDSGDDIRNVRDRLYVHIVWTTRGREPTIDAGVAAFLVRFLPAVARQERAGLRALGIVRTHLHLLAQLHPTTNISRLLQRLKGGSSVIAQREGHGGTRPLRWAKGYGIHSVSSRDLPVVRAYVLGQARRHPQEAIPGWEGGWRSPLDVGEVACAPDESRDGLRRREASEFLPQ
jgi:REP-associated tyrosine transposase